MIRIRRSGGTTRAEARIPRRTRCRPRRSRAASAASPRAAPPRPQAARPGEPRVRHRHRERDVDEPEQRAVGVAERERQAGRRVRQIQVQPSLKAVRPLEDQAERREHRERPPGERKVPADSSASTGSSVAEGFGAGSIFLPRSTPSPGRACHRACRRAPGCARRSPGDPRRSTGRARLSGSRLPVPCAARRRDVVEAVRRIDRGERVTAT